MAIRKGFADIVGQFPELSLAPGTEVSKDDQGCTECRHTLFIPCFDHPYCVNPGSPSYGFHYHSWDAACPKFEVGERYKEFACPFYVTVRGECSPERGDTVCPYEAFD